MQVVCETPCATRIDGQVVAMSPGESYDLPDGVAERLVRAGLAKRARAAKAPEKRTAKQGAGSSKKLDGAPENKSTGGDDA